MDRVETIMTLLNQLGVSTDFHPLSGISVDYVEGNPDTVKIYDDYTDGEYRANQVIAVFNRQLSEGPISFSDAWDLIYDFQIGGV